MNESLVEMSILVKRHLPLYSIALPDAICLLSSIILLQLSSDRKRQTWGICWSLSLAYMSSMRANILLRIQWMQLQIRWRPLLLPYVVLTPKRPRWPTQKNCPSSPKTTKRLIKAGLMQRRSSSAHVANLMPWFHNHYVMWFEQPYVVRLKLLTLHSKSYHKHLTWN